MGRWRDEGKTKEDENTLSTVSKNSREGVHSISLYLSFLHNPLVPIIFFAAIIHELTFHIPDAIFTNRVHLALKQNVTFTERKMPNFSRTHFFRTMVTNKKIETAPHLFTTPGT